MGRKTSPFSMMADCADMRMTLSPTGSSVNAPTAKVLDEGGAGAPILDQNRWLTAGSVPPVIHLDHLSLERWELEAFADHIEQRIEQNPPDSPDRVIGSSVALVAVSQEITILSGSYQLNQFQSIMLPPGGTGDC